MIKQCECLGCTRTRLMNKFYPCLFLNKSDIKNIKVVKKDPLEKDVEKRFSLNIKAANGHSWKFVSPNNRGVCDRVVLYHGRTIFVEIKRIKGKMSELQKVFRQKVLDNGGEFACVYGNDGTDEFMRSLCFDDVRFSGDVR